MHACVRACVRACMCVWKGGLDGTAGQHGVAHTYLGGLEAHDTAQRRGNADRAAAIGADRKRHDAGGDNACAASAEVRVVAWAGRGTAGVSQTDDWKHV